MSKSYYDLNAECFIENTVSLDMNAIYDPFLRKLSLHSRSLTQHARCSDITDIDVRFAGKGSVADQGLKIWLLLRL